MSPGRSLPPRGLAEPPVDDEAPLRLLAGCAAGSRPELERLYRATAPRLLGRLVVLLGDRAQAEDALQEVYIKVWERARHFDATRSRPLAWMLSIAHSHATDLIRARRSARGVDDEGLELADDGAGLAAWTPRVRPDPRTLQALLARVQGGSLARFAPRARAFPRTLVAALLGACLALGWVLYEVNPQPALTAHIDDAQGQGLWNFAAPADASRLEVRVLRQGLIPADRAFQIWALPDSGGKLVSLGLVPTTGGAVLTLNDAQRRALREAARIAVTLEPPGGSPTDVATGPILHVAPLRRSRPGRPGRI
jgi:RNA polymerase sigma-70 factor (ECF subfamily)